MVSIIFVPVSPSGTGKTLRASISAELFSNQDVAAENMSRKSCPATLLTLTIFTPSWPDYFTGSSPLTRN
jgi:tRNA splicing ligase